MSAYLAQRIEQTENIEGLLRTTVERLLGDNCRRTVEALNKETGEVRSIATTALFSFIGGAANGLAPTGDRLRAHGPEPLALACLVRRTAAFPARDEQPSCVCHPVPFARARDGLAEVLTKQVRGVLVLKIP